MVAEIAKNVCSENMVIEQRKKQSIALFCILISILSASFYLEPFNKSYG